MLLKKWILCLAFFGGLHQAVAAVHNDQLVISLESYQLTLLGLPQEILLDHNFKKEIDVVMYLATHQLGQERIATVIQILSADYGSSINNLTTFIQAALKKFTLLQTERNQLLFSLLFMTSLLKQHTHATLTRNLSVSKFHHEFHAAAAIVQQEFQTTAEQLKQFLPPPRKSWLKKALTYTVIGAATFTVWWFLTRSSREEPIVHEKRGAASEAVPALVDVPALVADIVDRLNDVEHGIEAGFGRIHAAHAELAEATHAAVEHGVERSRRYTDGTVADARGELSEQIAQLQALHQQLTADLTRHAATEAVARTAAIEALQRELAIERDTREAGIAVEKRERIAAIVAERTRNDDVRAEVERRVDATERTIASHARDLATTIERLARTEEDAAARRHEISAQGQAIAANERSVRPHIDEAARARDEHNAAQQSSRSIIDSVAGGVGTVVGVIAAAATTNPATVFFIGAEGTRARFDETRRAVYSKCTEIGDAAKERLAPLRPDLPHYNVGREPYVPPAAAAPADPVA